MGEVTYDEALNAFDSFDNEIKFPGIHPYYVITDAKRDNRLSSHFFIHKSNTDTFYYPFHVCDIDGKQWKDIQPPYGYGGPIASTTDPEFLENAWINFDIWCAENQILAEFIRFHPVAKNEVFFNGAPIIDRETVYINLQVDDLINQYDIRVRTAIRKAIKSGLHIEWWDPSPFLSEFSPIYKKSMENLGADSFYLFNEKYLESLVQWQNAYLGVCLFNSEVIATAIFINAGTKSEYHLSAQNQLGRKFSATNLLLHEASIKMKELGYQSLHLGGGTNTDPHNPLLFFKSGFSNLRALFKIGGRIHKPMEYDLFKKEWIKNTGKNTNRILFYR